MAHFDCQYPALLEIRWLDPALEMLVQWPGKVENHSLCCDSFLPPPTSTGWVGLASGQASMASSVGITKSPCSPSASSPPTLQTPGLELPPSPLVPEVTTPEPGIYHGICEYPPLGCQMEGGHFGHVGQGFLGQLGRLPPTQRHQAMG